MNVLANNGLKTVNYNAEQIAEVGAQKKNMCMAYTLAYCRTILDGESHSANEYWNGLGQPSWANYVHSGNENKQLFLKMIAHQIDSGKPVGMYVTKKYRSNQAWNASGDHWVCVIGYKTSADLNNLKTSDFYIIDPGDCGYDYLSDNENSFRFTTSNLLIAKDGNNKVDSDGSSAIFSSSGSATEITDTSAKISAKLNGTYNVSTCGFDIGLSSDAMSRVYENANTKVNSMWYSLGNGSKWYGTLQPGTTYYYRFYAIINGVEHLGAVQSFTTTGTPDITYSVIPYGNLEEISAGIGTFKVSGWVFDEDDLSKALQIHVYIGNENGPEELCAVMEANLHRSDVANAYPGVGEYHGFSQTIATNRTGNQTIYVYAINIGSGNENPLLGEKTITIAKDTEAPLITNLQVINQTKDGYTVTCTVEDGESGVNRVQFPTWTEANGQDDLAYDWENNSVVSGIINGSQVTFRVNASDHNGEMGLYHTDIYAYDNAGNRTPLGGCGVLVTLDNISPVISNVQVTDISETGYTVTCTVVDDVKLNRVQFPTWTAENGQDDLAQDWWNNNSITGMVNGSQVTFRVNASDHNNETGVYRTHIYAIDSSENSVCYEIPDIVVQHKHIYNDEVISPNCTEKGFTRHWCSCGNSYIDNYTEAMGHETYVLEGKNATCTQVGFSEGKKCSRCKEVIEKQEEIQALGHVFDEYIYDGVGTGTQTSICGREGCDETDTVTVSLPKGDTLKIELDTPTDISGLQHGESRTLKVISSTYGELPADKWIFTSSDTQLLEVDENGVITAVYRGTGSVTAQITAQFKTDSSKKAVLKVTVIAKQVEDIELLISEDEEYKEYIEVVTDETTGIQTVIVSKESVKNGNLSFVVTAVSKDVDGNEIPVSVKWSTSNGKVASVAALSGKQDQGLVTIQKGVNDIAVITATVSDNKNVSATIEVDVRDYTPRLSTNQIVLNTNKEENVDVDLITAYDAQDILDVSLEGNDAFDVTYDKEAYCVKFFAKEAQPNKKTYKLKLSVNTSKGLTEQDVTIKTSNTLPSVSVKQKNVFNTFYKDSEAFVDIVAKDAEIRSVELLDTTTFKCVYDAEIQQYKVKYADNYQGEKADTSAKINVWLEGYRTPVVKSLKISAKETQPKLQPSSKNTKLTYLNLNAEPITVLNKVTNENLNFETLEVKIISNSKEFVEIVSDQTELTFRPILQENHKFKDNKASHTIKLQVQADNWLKPIVFSHTVSVSTAKPTVSTKNTKLTLRTLYDNTAEILFKPNSSCEAPVSYIITPASTKANMIEQAEKIVFKHVGMEGWSGEDAWVVNTGINSNNLPNSGSYAFKITPVVKDVAGNDVELNTVTVTVDVNATNPTIKLKASSLALNAADYTDGVATEIIPSESGCPIPGEYKVVSATTNKKIIEQAEKINVTFDGWNVKVSFKNINDLPANGSYKYTITAFINDSQGNEIELKPVSLTVKVNTTAPKVTLQKTSITLNSSMKEEIEIVSTVNSGYKISDMKIEALKGAPGQDKLNVSYDSATQSISVKALDKKLKASTYKYKIVPVICLDLADANVTTDLKAVTFGVKVNNAAPVLVASAKGNIDLTNRSQGIIYTLTGIKNLNYDADKVEQGSFELTGPDKDLFEIGTVEKNAKGQLIVEVRAKADAELESNTTYQYQLSVKVNGLTEPITSSLFKVKTKQSALKFKVYGDTTIYHGRNAGNEVIVEATSPVGAMIEKMEILETKATTVPEGALSYKVIDNKDGRWTINYDVFRASKLKVGKSYQLALSIIPEGNGSNVKAQTLTITLKVKR